MFPWLLPATTHGSCAVPAALTLPACQQQQASDSGRRPSLPALCTSTYVAVVSRRLQRQLEMPFGSCADRTPGRPTACAPHVTSHTALSSHQPPATARGLLQSPSGHVRRRAFLYRSDGNEALICSMICKQIGKAFMWHPRALPPWPPTPACPAIPCHLPALPRTFQMHEPPDTALAISSPHILLAARLSACLALSSSSMNPSPDFASCC